MELVALGFICILFIAASVKFVMGFFEEKSRHVSNEYSEIVDITNNAKRKKSFAHKKRVCEWRKQNLAKIDGFIKDVMIPKAKEEATRGKRHARFNNISYMGRYPFMFHDDQEEYPNTWPYSDFCKIIKRRIENYGFNVYLGKGDLRDDNDKLIFSRSRYLTTTKCGNYIVIGWGGFEPDCFT